MLLLFIANVSVLLIITATPISPGQVDIILEILSVKASANGVSALSFFVEFGNNKTTTMMQTNNIIKIAKQFFLILVMSYIMFLFNRIYFVSSKII